MVEVTAHGGARPEHAEWQCKIYSRSGKSKKYPSLKEITGYGTGPGLGGWNCRHSMFPYYEGTTRAYTEDELEELKPSVENDIIFTDNEKLALNNYISSDSYKINEKLRNNIELDDKYINLRNSLDSALNKCNNYQGNIIRVLDITNQEKLNNFIKYNEIGKEVLFKEYLSFSNKSGYNNEANVFIYVKSKTAKDIRKFNSEESELLYKRGSKFFVENVQKIKGKIYILWRDIND